MLICLHMGWYLLNSTIEGDIPVLLVHVVVASTGLISHPDTVVFDLGGVLLSDLQENHSMTLLCMVLYKYITTTATKAAA